MMRTSELLEFAAAHEPTVITVADLVRYRMKTDSLVRKAAQAKMPTKYGEFTIHGYENTPER